MSHQPERKEKDCLNCGAQVQGRYCHRCGQENIITQQGFISLTKHFVYDIFHFDGKFFDTLKYLFFSPGKVPAEYVAGRRNHYLDPIRMYLFTSAIFFLVFFSTQKFQPDFVGDNTRYLSIPERFKEASKLYPPKVKEDSVNVEKFRMLLDTTITLRLERIRQKNVGDTAPRIVLDNEVYGMHPEPAFQDFSKIDSSANGDLVTKRLEQKWNDYKRQYGDNINQMLADLFNRFFHWFPYILFVSLPLFALILKLIYRKDKRFVYSDHAVFTLYHYIFSFLLLLLIHVFQVLQNKTEWGLFDWIGNLLIISWFVHLFYALKRFYGKSGGHSFLKFVLLNLLGLFSFILIFVIFIFVFILQL